MFSTSQADPDVDRLASVAADLLGARIESMEQVGGGRNSRVYRVGSLRGPFALKRYPPREVDGRDRLGTEEAALRLMERNGFTCVPRVVAVARAENLMILSWVEGTLVETVGESDIDQAAAFLAGLHALRTTPDFALDHLAAEACLSGAEIERQIGGRLARLDELAADEKELDDFLRREFRPEFARLVERARMRLATSGIDFRGTLAQEMRSLVPSDFGFHNSLRQPDGTLIFIDYEYFGWDDPAKLVADILLHPGTSVERDQKVRFRVAMERLYGSDRDFGRRLDAFYPLFGLRWALILLNEFLPHRWRQRVLAGAADDWLDAKRRQLARARELMAAVNQQVER